MRCFPHATKNFLILLALFVGCPSFAVKEVKREGCRFDFSNEETPVVSNLKVLKILLDLEKRLVDDPIYGALALRSKNDSDEQIQYMVGEKVQNEFGNLTFSINSQTKDTEEYGSGVLQIGGVSLNLTRGQDELMGTQKGENYSTEFRTPAQDHYQVRILIQYILQNPSVDQPRSYYRGSLAFIYVTRRDGK